MHKRMLQLLNVRGVTGGLLRGIASEVVRGRVIYFFSLFFRAEYLFEVLEEGRDYALNFLANVRRLLARACGQALLPGFLRSISLV